VGNFIAKTVHFLFAEIHQFAEYPGIYRLSELMRRYEYTSSIRHAVANTFAIACGVQNFVADENARIRMIPDSNSGAPTP
jgi:hypothetical protein